MENTLFREYFALVGDKSKSNFLLLVLALKFATVFEALSLVIKTYQRALINVELVNLSLTLSILLMKDYHTKNTLLIHYFKYLQTESLLFIC